MDSFSVTDKETALVFVGRMIEKHRCDVTLFYRNYFDRNGRIVKTYVAYPDPASAMVMLGTQPVPGFEDEHTTYTGIVKVFSWEHYG